MVHALQEIRRVLVFKGILIDLRPLANRWPVEVVVSRNVQVLGRLIDLPSGLADDDAANHAMLEGERQGWFVREQQQFFTIFLYWDNPEEMAAHMTEKWADFVELDADTLRAVRSTWDKSEKDKRVRVRMKMLLTRWRKGSDR